MMNSGYSLADIAAATGGGSNNRGSNDGLWGGDGAWLIIILFLFVFCGWGNNGWGGNSGSNGGGATPYFTSAATQADIQRGFDNQSVMNKLNGLEQGLCSLGYDQLSQMNGINQNISQTGFGIQQAINADTIANMQNTNALSSQLANCCCENRQGQADIKYQMATDTCALQNTMNNNTRDILENQNAGTRAILDYLCQDKISTLQAENQNLKLAASQQAQNNYLVNQLRPCPVPAYMTCNPWAASYGVGLNGCSCA